LPLGVSWGRAVTDYIGPLKTSLQACRFRDVVHFEEL
jgi:hypothetical protein